MNRYSVVYLNGKQYNQIYCQTQTEAAAALRHESRHKNHIPIGIYDAKTELFAWEPSWQQLYDQAGFDEQPLIEAQMIAIAQSLRQADAHPSKGRHNSIAQLLNS